MHERDEKAVAIEPCGKEIVINDQHPVPWYRLLDEIPPGMEFGWIFLVEVIEHMLFPTRELERLRRVLMPGGKVCITTPNANGWRARKDCFNWREAQNAAHITLFTEASLERCLKDAGFSKINRVRKPVDYGKKGFAKIALAATQIAGVDGGLRYIAQI